MLNAHLKTHDKHRQKKYKCHRCSYAADRKESYTRHLNSHKRKDAKLAAMKSPLKCKKGSNFCKNKRAYKDQMGAVHRKYQCDRCGKYFRNKKSLAKHILEKISIK